MKINVPKVSILIPTYNRENFIGECIQSALNQTYTDIEVIVIDNASTDKTWEICQEYAARNARLRIFRNETNIGPVRNWIRCVEEARGEFGKILFSDDLIAEIYLEKTLPYLLNDESVGFVFTSVIVGSDKFSGLVTYAVASESGKFPNTLFVDEVFKGGQAPVSPGCALFRMADLSANILTEIPSPTINDFASHGAGPDLLIFLLATVNYDNFAYVNEPLCFFRKHEGSISIDAYNSNKFNYLLRCFRQAKIWFANKDLNEVMLYKLCANQWVEECRMECKFITPSSFMNNYLQKNNSIPVLYLVLDVLSRIKQKLSKYIKRCLP